MKRDKLFSALWAFLLSFMLSLAAVMCPVSAFKLGIDTARLVGVCFWAAFFCSVCYALPLGPVPLGVGALLLGFLWRSGELELGVEAILNRLSRQYNKAYNWGIIRWGFRTADEMEPTILMPLCILGALIALMVAWSVCRRKPQVFGLLTALVPLAACFVVTDTAPKSGWLYLFFLAFLVLLLTGSSRCQEEKQGNRLTLYVLPVTALALLVLFAAVPRDGYTGQENAKKMVETIFHSDPMQLLMGHIDESGSTGGESATGAVDLRSVGYRIESDAQVLQVISPYTGNLYLRGRALDKYDGTSWSSWGAEVDYGMLPWPEKGLASVGEITITTRFAHRMLYLPYYTDTMQLLAVTGGMENDKKLTQYSFSCKRPIEASLLTSYYPSADTPADPEQKQLAADFMKVFPRKESVRSWASSLSMQVGGSYISPYHKAEAIASYVRNSASYDTQTSRMPLGETDFVKWFLEESDTGYCVHFATATAVLLQEAGIPARYVTGYLVPVKAGEPTPVLSNQAHAWVEYWLPGHGWTILEATPSDMRQTETQPRETEATVPAEITVPETTVPAISELQVTEKQQYYTVRYCLLGVLAFAVAVCGLEVQRTIRLRLRRQKRQTATPNQLALLYWVDGVRYAKYLKQLPDQQLFELAQMAKYSHHTVSQEQLQLFAAAEEQAIAQLKKRNFLLRLYYRWILVLY